MAVPQTNALLLAMAAVAILALIGGVAAQEGPAPAPASPAAVASPFSVAVGCALGVATFVVASALRI